MTNRFGRWFLDNLGRHREACEELGIDEPPADGPRLFERLRRVVTPALEEEDGQRPHNKGEQHA